MDWDNFFYRGADCRQANHGQQIAVKDNAAAGFNGQSLNVPQVTCSTSHLIRCLKDAGVVFSPWLYEADRDTTRHKITSKDM
jgi:hypothetical protein